MQSDDFLKVLGDRFDQHPDRHPKIFWIQVSNYLKNHPEIVKSLLAMEETGGEPDIIQLTSDSVPFFADMSPESPKMRRSVCYDREARLARKKNAPETSAQEWADFIGAELMNPEIYRQIQSLEPLDQRSSSWLQTPESIREKGGALFGDYRYGESFIYHNGAESYYSSRGCRVVIFLKDWLK